MFNKKGFGRDLFVSEGNERIRELGDHSGNSEERIEMFDLNLYNKSNKDMYSRRLSLKSVTGVSFYRKDLKQKETSKKLAFRRIKMIQTIQNHLPLLSEIKSNTTRTSPKRV